MTPTPPIPPTSPFSSTPPTSSTSAPAQPTLSKASLSKPAAIRRVRYAIQTFALFFAVTACCAFAVVLADRFPERLDVTATREHHLSERTLELLKSLQGQYEMVVAANFSVLDPQAARRTQDVLDNFGRASPNKIKTTIIDAASSRGRADLDAVLGRLIERFRTGIEQQRKGVETAITMTPALSAQLTALSDELLATKDSVKDGDPNAAQLRQFYADHAAACRVGAESLGTVRTSAQELLDKTIGHTPVPATDDAIMLLRKQISDTLTELGKMGNDLDSVATTTLDKAVSPATRDRTKAPAAAATQLRQEFGQVLAVLEGLPRTPVSSVARVLERSSAAIVIGPPGAARQGVTSVELADIYPPKPPEGSEGMQPDLRARTEELLAGAIASLARTESPIVVFVHGVGKHMAPDYLPVGPIVERMRLRGVDFAEWAAGLDSEAPILTQLDPQGKRPVVYAVIAMAPNTPEDATRLAKLVQGVGRLIAAGKSILLCEVPSTLPGIGQKDPMADLLAPLGLDVDTGRPLMRQTQGPRGRIVTTDLILNDPGTDHPIAQAIRGLPLYMPWAVPVRIKDGTTGVRSVVELDNQGKSIWAESEFVEFLRTPREQQALLINPPAPDSARDDPAGPWPLVGTIERTVDGRAQRLVVVGCNRWMAGDVIGAQTQTEGRVVPTYPGNIELLDASVYWLAGQDGMIGTSPLARQAPTIPPLSDAQLTAIRWTLIGGLPVLVLLIGALWRLAKG